MNIIYSEGSAAVPPTHGVQQNGELLLAWPGGVFASLRRVDGIALFVFCCGTTFLHGAGQQRLLGILMLAAFFFGNLHRFPNALRNAMPPPPEIVCYTLWVLWAGLTGPLLIVDKALFFRSIQISLQMVVMVWAVYAILQNQKSVDVVFLALMAGAVIQLFSVASGLQSVKSFLSANDRLMGLTQNANTLGFRMLWGIFAALFFWHLPGWKKLLRWCAILGLAAAAGYIIMATGSRKSALALVFMAGLWTVFGSSLTSGFSGYAMRFIAVVIVISVVIVLLPFVMKQTVLGNRFDDFLKEGRRPGMSSEEVDIMKAAKENHRYRMYVKGFQLFSENPIIGVGLGNFNRHFQTGQYSHSDYIEPLACTGFIGFFLYHAFKLFLFIRTFRLLRMVEDTQVQYRLKLVAIGVLTIMVIGLGTPHYTSQPTFILLAAFSAYTWRLLRVEKGKVLPA